MKYSKLISCRAATAIFSILCLTNIALALTSGDFEYQLITSDTEVEITGYTGTGGAVSIPATIDAKPVTSIGDSAFYQQTTISSVDIPNGVTSITPSYP